MTKQGELGIGKMSGDSLPFELGRIETPIFLSAMGIISPTFYKQ